MHWVSSNEVYKPRAYYAKWNRTERKKQILYIKACIWNLEKWCWWISMQGSSGNADIVSKVVTQWEEEDGMNWESSTETYTFSSVQLLSRVWLFATPWTPAHQPSLSITNSWSLLKLMSIELVMPSNHLILCHPLLPPSIFPSIGVFSNESALRIRWPKYWRFSFSISPSNEYSGLISFRMDWLDHLAVQRTLKSLLQHHSSKASILWHSAFLYSSSHIHTWLLEKQ